MSNSFITNSTITDFELDSEQSIALEALVICARNDDFMQLEERVRAILVSENQTVLDAAFHELSFDSNLSNSNAFSNLLCAARRSSSISGSRRLFGALLFTSGANQRKASYALNLNTLDLLRVNGFIAQKNLISFEQASQLTFQQIHSIHNSLILDKMPAKFDYNPKSNTCGAEPGIALFSASSGSSAWDEQTNQQISDLRNTSLALLSTQPGLFPIAIDYFANIIFDADAKFLPFAFHALVQNSMNLTKCASEKLVLCISFHYSSDTDFQSSFMRVAARSADEGFFIDGFQAAIPYMPMPDIIEYCSKCSCNAGVRQMQVIDYPLALMICQICDQPMYPLPQIPDWMLAANQCMLPTDGTHRH